MNIATDAGDYRPAIRRRRGSTALAEGRAKSDVRAF